MRCLLRFAAFAAAVILVGGVADAQTREAVQSPRLYVLDGGVLGSDPTRYHLTAEDVGETSLSIAAYLIVHPRGVLLWDTGAVPDGERISAEAGVDQRLVLANGEDRHVVLGPPLLAQLAAIGYTPADVTYLALSHGHWDHTANANAFARATWLVRPAERDAMFASKPEGAVRPETYSALAASRTELLTEDEHDVFGDGSVVLKSAPGHTPGHQVLYVKLAHTGGIVLSGDLYHYAAERALGRLPTFEFDAEETRASRREIEAFVERKDAELWIQHDLVSHRKLKKAPEYYD